MKKAQCLLGLFDVGAEGGTRTPTVLLPPAPQAGASANSATSAWWVSRLPGRPEGRPLQRSSYFGCAGAGAGAALFAGGGVTGLGSGCASGDGVGPDGCVSGVRPPTTDPGPRLPRMPSARAPTTKMVAQIHVARDRTVAPLRAPKAAWLLAPPNALAMSPPLPCCR